MDIDSIKRLRWPDDRETAKRLEGILRKGIRIEPLKLPPAFVAGVDAAFFDDKIVAVACLYEYPGLTPVEEAHVVREAGFPYIPGLLSFREGPAVMDAIKKLGVKPGAVIFDGQGIAHPRGLGIASFAGVLLNIPSVGCAKSRLVGSYIEPGRKKGCWSPLEYEGRVVGAVLRSKNSTRPVFVSPGHRIDLDGSIEIVLKCTGRYRITEPVRRADRLTKSLKRELLGGAESQRGERISGGDKARF